MDNHLKTLFVGTSQGEIYHTDANSFSNTAALLGPFKLGYHYIRRFRTNCDHTMLAVASKHTSIIPIDQLTKGPRSLKLKAHTLPVVWVEFHPKNPNLLITASFDSTVRTWDISKCVTNATDDGATEETIVTPRDCYEFNVNPKYAIFSPLNENCIIVGTQSTPFYVFNCSQKKGDFPPMIFNGR